jgi:hypothetical protein
MYGLSNHGFNNVWFDNVGFINVWRFNHAYKYIEMNNIHDQPEKMQKVMVSNFFRSYLANQFQKVFLQTGFGNYLPITFQYLTLLMQLFINWKNKRCKNTLSII